MQTKKTLFTTRIQRNNSLGSTHTLFIDPHSLSAKTTLFAKPEIFLPEKRKKSSKKKTDKRATSLYVAVE